MKRLLILLMLLLPTIANATVVNINEEVIKTANKYTYVREATNNNDAPEITKWLKNCGVPAGNSYCAAFTVNMYKETFDRYGLKSPVPMYAGVSRFAEYCVKHPFDFKVISTKKMNWGIDKPQVGDLISWKHGSSTFNGFGYMGHQGLTREQVLVDVHSIEANTKAGAGGDQSGAVKGDLRYGHEGVYKRTRSIALNTKFPIMYFIRLNKRQYDIK